MARWIAVRGAALVLWIGVACGGDPDARDQREARAADDEAIVDGFDLPVGAPDGLGYYDAQRFGANQHLGEDWNGNRGGDSDLGDPVAAIAHGRVTFAGDVGGGWGNVVRVVHRTRDVDVESLYAHLDAIAVAAGAAVQRGQVIGTIGTAGGQYVAHLHLELRVVVGLPIGGGYGDVVGQVDPSAFIATHRPP